MNNDFYLENFSKNVDDFINSKFLLVESKLSKFLSNIAKNKLLYALIEVCLKDFNFETEFKVATEGEELVLPSKAEKIVAFVFCLLVEADNKKLDFYKFLKLYFNSKDVEDSFRLFNEKVIIPFKNCVIVLCSEPEKEEEPEAPREPTFYEKFLPVAKQLISLSKMLPRCENCEPILIAMLDAAKQNNMKLFNALKTSLMYSTKNRKFIKQCREVFGN